MRCCVTTEAGHQCKREGYATIKGWVYVCPQHRDRLDYAVRDYVAWLYKERGTHAKDKTMEQWV